MFPWWETHITRDICFPGERTHITRDMCFPGGKTHITRDMCFPGGGTHITRDMCFPGEGTHKKEGKKISKTIPGLLDEGLLVSSPSGCDPSVAMLGAKIK